jgi:hypothetical protein
LGLKNYHRYIRLCSKPGIRDKYPKTSSLKEAKDVRGATLLTEVEIKEGLLKCKALLANGSDLDNTVRTCDPLDPIQVQGVFVTQ